MISLAFFFFFKVQETASNVIKKRNEKLRSLVTGSRCARRILCCSYFALAFLAAAETVRGNANFLGTKKVSRVHKNIGAYKLLEQASMEHIVTSAQWADLYRTGVRKKKIKISNEGRAREIVAKIFLWQKKCLKT